MKFKEWLKNSKYKDKDPLSVTTIKCSNAGLTDLSGIEQFENLERLNCSWNNLTSLKGIENLTKLNTLYCQYNKLINLKGDCSGNHLEHKNYNDNFNSVKEYQRYLKSFYRKEKIENLKL